MATTRGNRWKAMIVLSCDHAGLMPSFQRLEDEIRRTLSSLDDPGEVRHYITAMMLASQNWLNHHPWWASEK